MSVQLDSPSYGLTDNMTITWSIPNVSVNNSMGIWLFETNATYNPTSPPLYTSNKWALVYNTNPLLTRYTVNLGQLLKSYPDGVLLSEGPFYTVLVTDDLGNLLAALPTTFSVSTTNLSLGKVLTGGNYATTDIDMINNAIVSSGSTLQLGDSSTPSVTINNPILNAPITPNYTYPIASGKVGSSLSWTYNTPFNLSPSIVKNIATISLPVGVYYLQASILTPTIKHYQGLGISPTSATIAYECWSNIVTDDYIWFALNVSTIVVISAPSTPYYVIAQAGDTRTLLQVRAQCYRIA